MWINKCDKLPKEGEYVLIYPPYIRTLFEDEPRHVCKWRNGSFKYYLGGSVHSVTWKDVTHWMSLPKPPVDIRTEVKK